MSYHKQKDPQDEFDIEKKQAAVIALQLVYGNAVAERILNAKTSSEIGRILKQARLDQDK